MLSAASAALTVSDTSSRKPIATTRPNERRRSITNALSCVPGLGFTRQMVLNATCSSRNAPVEVSRKVSAPSTVATRAGTLLAGAFEKRLNRLRTVAADEVIELADDLPAHGFIAEYEAGNGNRHQQHRRNRKQREEGERCAQPRAVVKPPRAGGAFEDSKDHRNPM